MLELTSTCPSLRLINGPRVPKGGFIRRKGTLIYLRPAGGPAEQIDLAKPRYNKEGRTTVIEILDEGRSTDFTWQLYSVVGPAGEDVWKAFLPCCDNLRFAC
ncbi:hypothetical protein M407DRAFT_241897 [Tulasnella calospora MUT 4182]|uniref:Uncharacterized protein n=1 Tax=Tulasnella calospora MUT 4182 TaxID=1051891 RepID=A0A0C3LBE7_9AGAM|nr:hypothetical protein M407DRAFT_241897 [Tulasnella calospora MUT 4182]